MKNKIRKNRSNYHIWVCKQPKRQGKGKNHNQRHFVLPLATVFFNSKTSIQESFNKTYNINNTELLNTLLLIERQPYSTLYRCIIYIWADEIQIILMHGWVWWRDDPQMTVSVFSTLGLKSVFPLCGCLALLRAALTLGNTAASIEDMGPWKYGGCRGAVSLNGQKAYIYRSSTLALCA